MASIRETPCLPALSRNSNLISNIVAQYVSIECL